MLLSFTDEETGKNIRVDTNDPTMKQQLIAFADSAEALFFDGDEHKLFSMNVSTRDRLMDVADLYTSGIHRNEIWERYLQNQELPIIVSLYREVEDFKAFAEAEEYCIYKGEDDVDLGMDAMQFENSDFYNELMEDETLRACFDFEKYWCVLCDRAGTVVRYDSGCALFNDSFK